MCVFDQETKRVKDGRGRDVYDIHGEPLEVNTEGEYTDVPEKCFECSCVQTEPNWKDFTNHTVHVCEQCGQEVHIIY